MREKQEGERMKVDKFEIQESSPKKDSKASFYGIQKLSPSFGFHYSSTVKPELR